MFWFITQPTNRFWLKNEELTKAGARFFALDHGMQTAKANISTEDWKRLRDRWEYSHLLRAVFSGTALIVIVVAVAL